MVLIALSGEDTSSSYFTRRILPGKEFAKFEASTMSLKRSEHSLVKSLILINSWSKEYLSIEEQAWNLHHGRLIRELLFFEKFANKDLLMWYLPYCSWISDQQHHFHIQLHLWQQWCCLVHSQSAIQDIIKMQAHHVCNECKKNLVHHIPQLIPDCFNEVYREDFAQRLNKHGIKTKAVSIYGKTAFRWINFIFCICYFQKVHP